MRLVIWTARRRLGKGRGFKFHGSCARQHIVCVHFHNGFLGFSVHTFGSIALPLLGT
jgi:hypothetical protein